MAYGVAVGESVGDGVDALSLGDPEGEGVTERVDVGVGLDVLVFDLEGVGLGERVVRVGRGVWVSEGVTVGVVGATLTAGGGRTSR